MKTTKCVIYCRVSSKEQEETGYSLDAQEKLLKEYASKKDCEAIKVFRVSESASGKQIRTIFNEMLQYLVKHNVNVLLCEKIDRLTRNLKDAALVSDWIQGDENREIHFVKENFVVNKHTRAHENLVWDMKVAIARFYTNNLSEEVKKGQKEKIAQGWIPTRPPIGYKTIGEKGHKIHVIDEQFGPYIKKIFEYYATGNYSMKALNEKIYQEGFRTALGKKHAKSRIDNILQEPFYHGSFTWKGKTYAGKQEPLITKELFGKVQDIRVRKLTPCYSKHTYQFRKMATCGECGGTITADIQKGKVYYHCSHYKACSQKKYTLEEKLEAKLLGVFEFFKNITPSEAEEIKLKIKENHAQEIEYKESMLKTLSESYGRLQKRLDNLYDDRLDGKITPEFWEKKQLEITTEQTGVHEQINKMKSEEAKYFEIWLNIIDLATRAREIYEKRSPEERRILLAHIFSTLVLKDQNVIPTLKKSVEVLSQRVQQHIDDKNIFEQKKAFATKTKALSGYQINSLLPR